MDLPQQSEKSVEIILLSIRELLKINLHKNGKNNNT